LPLQFQAQVTEDQVRQVTAGIFWRQALQPKLLGAIAVFLIFGQVLLRAVLRQGSWTLHAGLGLLMLLSVAGVAWVASRHYVGLALQNFQRIVGAPVQVRLDEDAYHFEAAWGQGSLPWTQFQSLWRFEDAWVLLQHAEAGASVVLPAAALDDAARAFLLRKLTEVKGELA
jgi:hypothetical protein